jgi:hypothetical protein
LIRHLILDIFPGNLAQRSEKMTGQGKKVREVLNTQRNAPERQWRHYESPTEVMKKVSDEAVKQINELFGNKDTKQLKNK